MAFLQPGQVLGGSGHIRSVASRAPALKGAVWYRLKSGVLREYPAIYKTHEFQGGIPVLK